MKNLTQCGLNEHAIKQHVLLSVSYQQVVLRAFFFGKQRSRKPPDTNSSCGLLQVRHRLQPGDSILTTA